MSWVAEQILGGPYRVETLLQSKDMAQRVTPSMRDVVKLKSAQSKGPFGGDFL